MKADKEPKPSAFDDKALKDRNKGEGKRGLLARIWAWLLLALGIRLDVFGADPENEAQEVNDGEAPRGWVFTLMDIGTGDKPRPMSRVLVPYASGNGTRIEYVAKMAETYAGKWARLRLVEEGPNGPRIIARRERRAAMSIMRRVLNREMRTGRRPRHPGSPDVTAHYGKDGGVREPGWMPAGTPETADLLG